MILIPIYSLIIGVISKPYAINLLKVALIKNAAFFGVIPLLAVILLKR